MKKFKIFFGTMEEGHTADEKANEWLNEYSSSIEVIDFKYQQARFGDHSICIEYEETRAPYRTDI